MCNSIEAIVNNAMQQKGTALLAEFEQTLSQSKLTSHQKLMGERKKFGYFQDKEIKYFFKEFNGLILEAVSSNNSYLVMGFAGKARKPVFYYSFNTEEKKNKFISDWAISQIKKINLKAEHKAERKQLQENALDSVNVGDVFCSSWGYEQTNIDYYQVIAIKGKSTITLRQISSEIVENTSDLTGKKVPCKDDFIDEAFDKRICVYSKFSDGKPRVSVNLSSFQTASLKYPNAKGEYEPDYFSHYY